MTLRYTFPHLFYANKINKKRLYQVLVDLDTATGGESVDISAIKEAIGKASGEGAGGILKDVADLKTDVGASDSAGLKKRCKDLEDAIGDADTEGTILARIKALEDAT